MSGIPYFPKPQFSTFPTFPVISYGNEIQEGAFADDLGKRVPLLVNWDDRHPVGHAKIVSINNKEVGVDIFLDDSVDGKYISSVLKSRSEPVTILCAFSELRRNEMGTLSKGSLEKVSISLDALFYPEKDKVHKNKIKGNKIPKKALKAAQRAADALLPGWTHIYVEPVTGEFIASINPHRFDDLSEDYGVMVSKKRGTISSYKSLGVYYDISSNFVIKKRGTSE